MARMAVHESAMPESDVGMGGPKMNDTVFSRTGVI